MKPYPKNIYQTAALIQKYKDAGLVITDDQKVETALNEIGFYRLRGYSFHLYDNATKKYIPNVTFDTICHIYNFDMELRSLLFGMTCKIEVALRSRFCEALLQKNDALIYLDPSIFKDKAIFWRNTASISSEIARSTDVFITHNYDNHDGQILPFRFPVFSHPAAAAPSTPLRSHPFWMVTVNRPDTEIRGCTNP